MKTLAEALAILNATGSPGVTFTVDVVYARSFTVPLDYVISQNPPADEIVAPDATVTLTVSLGPPPASRWTGTLNDDDVPLHEVAAALPQVIPVVFVFLNVEGTPLYLNNSNVTLEWDGHTWLGAGKLGDIDAISEAQDLIAQPVKMTLSGVDSDVVTDARNATYQGRDAVIYLGLLEHDTLARVDDPEEIWSGFMDVMECEADKGIGQITLTCEHWLRRAPVVSLQTDQEQQVRSPGDLFYQFTQDIANYVGDWGGSKQNYGGGGGSRGGPRRGHVQEF